MYLHYDTQSSHEGYIDMQFKEIKHSPVNELSEPLTPDELFDAVLDGYYYEGLMPDYMEKVFDHEGDYKSARISKRLIKGWCYRMCSA
jgi:hypothetical protein